MHLGMDIGGTKVETVVLDDKGKLVWQQRIATPKASIEQFLQGIIGEVHAAQDWAGEKLSLGFGLPGAIDTATCLVKIQIFRWSMGIRCMISLATIFPSRWLSQTMLTVSRCRKR